MARKRHEEASGFNVTPLLPKSKAQSEPRAETQQSSEANIAEKRKQEEPLAVAPTKKAKKNKAGRKKDEDAEPSATTKDAASDPQKVESGKKQEGIHKAEKSDNVVPEKVESEVDSAMTAKEKRKGKNKNKTVQSNSADGEVDNDAQPSNEIPVHAKNGKKRKAEKDQGLMEDGDAMAVDAAGEGSGTGPTADSAGEPQKKKKKMRHRSKTDETETSGKDTKTSNSAQKPLSKYGTVDVLNSSYRSSHPNHLVTRKRSPPSTHTKRKVEGKEHGMYIDRRIVINSFRMLSKVFQVCFLCRNAGHSIKFCPKATEAEKKVPVKSEDSVAVSGICYKCGSTEHTSSQCRKIVDPSKY